MMRVLAIVLIALTGCTANTVSQRHRLIPADAELVFGVDIAAVLGSDAYHANAPQYRDSIPFVWLDAARACGIDPIQSHLSVLGGTDHEGQLALTFTGLDIGDPSKLRCISDRLTAPEAGPASFSVHDREYTGFIADRDHVATIVDPHTVVFATRGWAESVHLLNHGTGVPHPAQAPAGRHHHAWVDGRPFIHMPIPPATRRLHATFDLADDLRIDLRLDYAADDAARIQQNGEADGFCSALAAVGMPCKSAAWTDDVHHLDLATSLARFVELAPLIFTNKPPAPIVWGGTC